ncbi:MAG: aminotransferase class III-fold pyridoxal phosphate-dependent enzyme [Rhodospirillaceae bacterium]|nr:aminotransferase class III-fold pyridoxal phosphate-dependent enzyme [Rhodospirillaceae bacterium]
MPDTAALLPRNATARAEAVVPERTAATAPSPPPALVAAKELAADVAPFSVAQAHGARIIDATGRSFIDLNMGHGALLLGHGAAAIKDALAAQLERGWQHGFHHAARDELVDLISAVGATNEKVTLCDTSSDATMLALRAARAFTGRPRVALFAGAHHGLHDAALMTRRAWLEIPANDALPTADAHLGAGVPAELKAGVGVLPFGADAALDLIQRHRRELAAVMVEPCPDNALSTGHGPWLRALQATCREAGVVFILDETLTGFRLRFGGAQEAFDLAPDLTIYGGALGGGLPLAAIAGRREIMDVFAGAPAEKAVFSGSVHAGNPLSVAAALAFLRVLSDHRDTVYTQLNGAAATLAVNFNSEAKALGLHARMRVAGSMFRIDFGARAAHGTPAPHLGEREQSFYRRLFDRNILVHASMRCFFSTAHTVGDLAALTSAMTEGLRLLAEEATFPR